MSENDEILIGEYEDFYRHFHENMFFSYLFLNEKAQVFHYTNLENIGSIIQTSALRFTESSCLNDSSEGFYIVDVLKELLRKNIFDSEFCNEILISLDKDVLNDIYDLDCDKYFICCFSLNDDSLPLWVNYTNKCGAKLGFSLSDIYRTINSFCCKYNISIDPCKVIYGKEKTENFLLDNLQYIYSRWEKGEKNFIKYFLNYINSVKFAFKHKAFEAEEEYRIVLKTDKNFIENAIKDDIVKTGLTKNGLKSFLDIPFSKESLNSLKISPTLEEKPLKSAIVKMFCKNGFDANLPITLSDIPLRF
ncbi:MAG: DUF2971 domain-containing protein [Clostridia bacterium]|nr:DUF2971 domain-containing protein [Clostridia bacterium]